MWGYAHAARPVRLVCEARSMRIDPEKDSAAETFGVAQLKMASIRINDQLVHVHVQCAAGVSVCQYAVQ